MDALSTLVFVLRFGLAVFSQKSRRNQLISMAAKNYFLLRIGKVSPSREKEEVNRISFH